MSTKQKIIVILGPTASGKSALATRVAQWLKRHGKGAEIISADSRQVYRGLDIGTCKISRDKDPNSKYQISNKIQISNFKRAGYYHQGIPHHLLDVASPKKPFSAADFQKTSQKALADILRRGKFPIICGGTGHYIDALLGVQVIPDVPPNPKLRARFDKLTTERLFAMLQKLDPRRAANIDRHNPRRLIRALEIVLSTGRPVPSQNAQFAIRNSQFSILKIGLTPSPVELRRRLEARLEKDVRRGLLREVTRLHKNGLSWKRLNELGLEYRLVAQYLRKEISREDMLQKMKVELWRYAKRQMTWFKRDKNIRWVKNERVALALTQKELR